MYLQVIYSYICIYIHILISKISWFLLPKKLIHIFCNYLTQNNVLVCVYKVEGYDLDHNEMLAVVLSMLTSLKLKTWYHTFILTYLKICEICVSPIKLKYIFTYPASINWHSRPADSVVMLWPDTTVTWV